MSLTVRDLMTEDVLSLPRSASLAEVHDLMSKHDFRHVPIVDGDELAGLISHRDLSRRVLGALDELTMSDQRQALSAFVAEDIMSRGIEGIDPETPIAEAAQLMFENKYGCLPVVENTHLIGILTESDFVRHAAENG